MPHTIKLVPVLVQQLALISLILLGVNMTGLIVPLRSPDLATASTAFGPEDLSLTADEVRQLATRHEGEPLRALITRATLAVSQGMAHDWTPGAYNLHVPARENWVLWLWGHFDQRFQLWEFYNYQKALERGVGQCSQHAIVLNGLLRAQGVRSYIVALGHLHVVNRVEVATGEWVIADPDVGIVLPDLALLTPDVVGAYYGASDENKASAQPYIEAYAAPVRLAATSEAYNPGGAAFEWWAYMLKWWVPLVLLAPAALSSLQRHHASQQYVYSRYRLATRRRGPARDHSQVCHTSAVARARWA